MRAAVLSMALLVAACTHSSGDVVDFYLAKPIANPWIELWAGSVWGDSVHLLVDRSGAASYRTDRHRWRTVQLSPADVATLEQILHRERFDEVRPFERKLIDDAFYRRITVRFDKDRTLAIEMQEADDPCRGADEARWERVWNAIVTRVVPFPRGGRDFRRAHCSETNWNPA